MVSSAYMLNSKMIKPQRPILALLATVLLLVSLFALANRFLSDVAAQTDRQEPDDFLLMLPLVGVAAELSPQPLATPTPLPTATLAPTDEPTQTVTPLPTNTPAPSPTPTPEPTISIGNVSFPTDAAILPLGDSRVAGDRPVYESYRYELWKNLLDNGWTFDLVGDQLDGAEYPAYNSLSFDPDHAGVSGATSGQTLTRVRETITVENAPDIVLLGIGGNDYLQGAGTPEEAIDNINAIIDHLQGVNPEVIIFLEQIAPALSFFMFPSVQADFDQFNADILVTAAEQSDGSSIVIAVDMAADWSDAYLADIVHYNETGAKVVADRYDAAMDAYFSFRLTSLGFDEK